MSHFDESRDPNLERWEWLHSLHDAGSCDPDECPFCDKVERDKVKALNWALSKIYGGGKL